MRKLLLSVLTLGVVSVAALGATRAYFSDTESILGNTITTGSVDIEIYGNGVVEQPFTLANVLPGVPTAWQELKIANVGFAAVVNHFSVQKTAGSQLLWDNMDVEVRVNSTSGTVVYTGDIQGFDRDATVQLPAGTEHKYYMKFTLDPNFTEQGKTAEFKIIVTGNQAH
jgi:predicted ribosomally synthesized peptide with SipW-like signal peptide